MNVKAPTFGDGVIAGPTRPVADPGERPGELDAVAAGSDEEGVNSATPTGTSFSPPREPPRGPPLAADGRPMRPGTIHVRGTVVVAAGQAPADGPLVQGGTGGMAYAMREPGVSVAQDPIRDGRFILEVPTATEPVQVVVLVDRTGDGRTPDDLGGSTATPLLPDHDTDVLITIASPPTSPW